MAGEKKNVRDREFLDYFRNRFFVDRRGLIVESDEDDNDAAYNFRSGEHGTSENVFENIHSAFIGEKHQELGAFLSKMDILEENMAGIFGENEDMKGKEPERLPDDRGTIGVDFRNMSYIINNTDPYEFYNMINGNADMFNNMVLPEISGYEKFTADYEKSRLEMKGEEIAGIQRLFTFASPMFNKTFFEEFKVDMSKPGEKNRLKSYMDPLVRLPEKILTGAGSVPDMTDTVANIAANSRLYDMIGDRGDFKSGYEDIKETMKEEFCHTDFDKIDEIGKVGNNFKINTMDSYVEALDFNVNDYLKEYRRIKPLLSRYNIRKMNRRNLKRLYEDRERLIRDIENKNGTGLQNITRSLIINEMIVNSYLDKKLKGKPFIVIDNMNSGFFGLKVPVINGKIDIECINAEFDIFDRNEAKRIIKEAQDITDSRIRLVNQLIKTDRDLFNLNDAENEIRNVFFNVIGIGHRDEIEKIITDRKRLGEVLNESTALYAFNNSNYEFRSRLDCALVKIIVPLIEEDYDDMQKLVSYINENSVIIGNRHVYNNDFEELYRNISENPDFKVEKSDMYILRRNKGYISKMIREGVPVPDIIARYSFRDKDRIAFILEVFKESLKNTVKESKDTFQPVFKDEFLEGKTDYGALRDKNSYIRKRATEFSEIIEGNQEKVETFNIRNREILDENFENVMKNSSRINLINEMEKTGPDIEDLRFFGQNSENIRRRSNMTREIRSMQNKVTSTMAIDILLRNRNLEDRYREVLNLTDRFYIEIMKDLLKKKWQLLLKDYYTDRELLRNNITINPDLNAKLRREIEYNLQSYNEAGIEEKVRILNNIMSNIDVRSLNREFFREELRKVARLAKSRLNEDRVKLTDNNRKMHELLNRDIEKLKRMDEETKKAVNRFAERFMNRLEGECEDKEFSERFGMNVFFDREFIDYITKYENVDNSYIRDLLLLDDEGTTAETSYQNQSFQETGINDRLARYRENMKISSLRKTNLIGKKVFENPELKKFKNSRRKMDEEIEEVKSRMKEILNETEREYEEDIRKISHDREKVLENQDKTKEKIKEGTKITVQKSIEEKKKEERNEAAREHEEDMRKIREEKEKEAGYVREFM